MRAFVAILVVIAVRMAIACFRQDWDAAIARLVLLVVGGGVAIALQRSRPEGDQA
jgi:hypothetical protein